MGHGGAAGSSTGRRHLRRRAGRPGEVVRHRSDARGGDMVPRDLRRQRDCARLRRRAVHGGLGGHLLLRGHVPDANPHRRQGDHRAQRLRVSRPEPAPASTPGPVSYLDRRNRFLAKGFRTVTAAKETTECSAYAQTGSSEWSSLVSWRPSPPCAATERRSTATANGCRHTQAIDAARSRRATKSIPATRSAIWSTGSWGVAKRKEPNGSACARTARSNGTASRSPSGCNKCAGKATSTRTTGIATTTHPSSAPVHRQSTQLRHQGQRYRRSRTRKQDRRRIRHCSRRRDEKYVIESKRKT